MKLAPFVFPLIFIAAMNSARSESRPVMGDISNIAQVESRPVMGGNEDEIQIGDALKSVESSFDSEDLSAYVDCFKDSMRKSVRRKSALLFASESCSMDIEEFHFIEIEEDRAEVAVKYSIGGSKGSSEIVSTVKLVKEKGNWLMAGESVSSRHSSKSAYGRPPAQNHMDAEWNPYNPDKDKVSPTLHHLIGDIGVRPGMGCADGNCANGRCER